MFIIEPIAWQVASALRTHGRVQVLSGHICLRFDKTDSTGEAEVKANASEVTAHRQRFPWPAEVGGTSHPPRERASSVACGFLASAARLDPAEHFSCVHLRQLESSLRAL